MALSEVSTPSIPITSAAQQLIFRNRYSTEEAFDGLVLEISVAGGAFQDILAAGGTFEGGGYNSTLDTGFGNPLPGRQAWSGISAGSNALPGFISTVVNLPTAAVGQSVQFKWRQGSDNSVSRTGFGPGSGIDTVMIARSVCDSNAPVVTSALSRKRHGSSGFLFDLGLPLVPLGGAIGVEDRAGAIMGAHQILLNFSSPVTVNNASVVAGAGRVVNFSINGSVVTVNLVEVPDRQRLGLMLKGVKDGNGAGDVMVSLGFLVGDVNGNGVITGSDIAQTKAATAGGTTSAENFRADVNASGSVNASDVSLVKANSGRALP